MGASSSKGPYISNEELVRLLESDEWQAFVRMVEAHRKVVKRPIRARNGDTGVHIIAGRAGGAIGLHEVLRVVTQAYTKEKGSPLTPAEYKQCCSKVCNLINDRGRTPLMAAAKAGSVDCVKFLLDHEANVWIRDRAGGANVLHYAASAGHEDIVTILLDHARANPAPPGSTCTDLLEMGNAGGLTALHYAVWHKRHKVVTHLCDLGASIYATSTWSTGGDAVPCASGSTPLHIAAACGSARCTKALMRAYTVLVGAAEDAARATGLRPPETLVDPRLMQDRQGNLPFAVALQHGHTRTLSYLHPFTPLADMFADERPEERVVGVPRLVELAAMAAQQVLLSELSKVEESLCPGSASKAQDDDSLLPSAAALAAAATAITCAGCEACGVPPPASPSGLGTPATVGPQSGSGAAGTPAACVCPPSPGPLLCDAAQGAGAAADQELPVPAMRAGEASPRTSASAIAVPACTTTGPFAAQCQLQSKPSFRSRISASERNLAALDLPPSSSGAAGAPSWVERRGAWRAKLPPLPSGGSRLTLATDASGAVYITNVSGSGDGAGGGTRGSAPRRGGAVAAGGTGAAGGTSRWIARRSAWRSTLMRHQQQLLQGTGNVPAAPGDANRSMFASTQSLAELRTLSKVVSRVGSRDGTNPHAAAGTAGAGNGEEGSGQQQQAVPVPLAAAVSLRLLGMAGGSPAPAMGQKRNTSSQRLVPMPEESDLPHHPEDMDAGPASLNAHPSQIQIAAAINMVRIHRLTNGVMDGADSLRHGDTLDIMEGFEECGTPQSQGSQGVSINAAVMQHVQSQLFHQGASPASSHYLPSGTNNLLVQTQIQRSASNASQHTAVLRSSYAGEGWAVGAAGATAAAAGGDGRQPDSGATSDAAGPAGPAGSAMSGGLQSNDRSVRAGSASGVAPAAMTQAASSAQMLTRLLSRIRSATASEAGGDGCDDTTCGVCLEDGTFVDLKGCSHRICVSCAKELVRLHDLKPALCPFCRRLIQGFCLYQPHKQAAH